MKSLHIKTFALAGLLACLSLPALAADYTRYCNSRYGFCVDYPPYFGMEPSPINNDGRNFMDNEGFTMSATGINNVLDASIADEMQSREEDFDTVTFRKRKDDWYVLSGYKDDLILYVKSWVGKGSINTVYMQYPKAMKADYDETVSHIVKSFQPGDLSETH
jgi:hypothetical protein